MTVGLFCGIVVVLCGVYIYYRVDNCSKLPDGGTWLQFSSVFVAIAVFMVYAGTELFTMGYFIKQGVYASNQKFTNVPFKSIDKRLQNNDDVVKYLSDAEDFDILYFTYKNDLSFIDCIISPLKNDWYTVSFERNTGRLELKGSDLTKAQNVVSVSGRYGLSARKQNFIRVNDTFYQVNDNIEDIVIDDEKDYIITYAENSKGTVSDLTGVYETYDSCRLYIKGHN